MASLDEKEVKKAAVEFFEKLAVSAEVSIEQDKEENILVKAAGADLGILIGYHGETLEALQLLLGQIVNKKLGLEPWRRVVLDVGGWRGEREEALKELVKKAIERVEQTQEAVDLPPMPASQRRFIHILLSEKDKLEAHSELDGPDRHIVITYKN